MRPSVFVYCAALIAAVAMQATACGLSVWQTPSGAPLPMLYAFIGIIFVSGLVRQRYLRDRRGLHLILLGILVAAIWITTPDRESSGTDGMGSTHARNIFSEVCAAEMTLRFWYYQRSDPRRSTLIILAAACLTFLCACNTTTEICIRIAAPFFAFCIAFAVRDYRSRVTIAAASARQARRVNLVRGLSVSLQVAAIAVALGGAFWGIRATDLNKAALSDLGNRLLSKSNLDTDTSGMSGQPILGSTFGLRGSAQRVLRIENFNGVDHFCGVSYNQYAAGSWGPPVTQLSWHDVSDRFLDVPRHGPPHGIATTMRVTRLVSDNPLLFLPLSTVSLETDDASFDVTQGTSQGGPLRVRAPAPYSYSLVVPDNNTYQGLLAEPLTPEERAADLDVPDNATHMDEVKRLAQQIGGKLPRPLQRVEAVTNYLISTHPYSLTFTRSESAYDPVADFLLSRPYKGAHCEYFASAAVILLRYLKVPARYVTGYYVHEPEGSPGQFVVRQRDAHAWCEAWIQGVGWTTVEATPGDGRPDALASKTPVEPWRRAWEWMQDWLAALNLFLGGFTPVQIGGAMLLASCVGGGAWAYVALRRRPAVATAETRALYAAARPELTDLANRFEAAWKRCKAPPLPRHLGYREYLRQLETENAGKTAGAETIASPSAEPAPPALVERALRFAELYETARFGRPLDDAQYAELIRRLEEVEKTKVE